MTTHEWKPGDLITAEVSTRPGKRHHLVRVDDHEHAWRILPSGDSIGASIVLDASPLIVIDPEDRQSLAEAFKQATYGSVRTGSAGASAPRTWDEMADIFLDLLQQPPKPAEPVALGAVVEDAEGHRWTKARDNVTCWCSSHGLWREWDRVSAVRVLSEGVTP